MIRFFRSKKKQEDEQNDALAEQSDNERSTENASENEREESNEASDDKKADAQTNEPPLENQHETQSSELDLSKEESNQNEAAVMGEASLEINQEAQFNRSEVAQSDIEKTPQNVEAKAEKKQSLFSRIFKTRGNFGEKLKSAFQVSAIDEDLYDSLEEQLIMADVGVQTSMQIVEKLRAKVKQNGVKQPQQAQELLRDVMVEILETDIDDALVQRMFENKIANDQVKKPHVIMVVGVNGVGKTTTIAKMAYHYRQQGLSVIMAAGDTFRAAAIEQLQNWGERMQIDVIAQSHGADSAAVAFDAYNAACARNADILIVDTAGRQHTKDDLMQQLKKVKRVLSKHTEDVPHEVLMVVDAGYGQNVVSQVQHFNEAVDLTGLCVTKLDGTAKGGVVLALANEFHLPIKYIGVGEAMQDLRRFNAREFVQALYPDAEQTSQSGV